MEWFQLFTRTEFSLFHVCLMFLVLIIGYAMGRNSAGRPFAQSKETDIQGDSKEPPFHDSELDDQDYIDTAINREEYPGRIPTVRD